MRHRRWDPPALEPGGRWLRLYAPYDPEFIEAFKADVPLKSWDPLAKTWLFPAEQTAKVQALCREFFGATPAAPPLDEPRPPPPPPQQHPLLKPHEILGVRPGASSDELRSAYRRLSLAVHPDQGGSSGLFILLNDAFEAMRPTR